MWGRNRHLRRVGALAFFAPGIAEGLRRYPELVNPLLIAGQLFAFRPAEALWDKPFPDWTEPDWAHHDNLSLLWLIGEARVIGLPGLEALVRSVLVTLPLRTYSEQAARLAQTPK